MQFLVTGAAGFIGFHTTKLLLEQGHRITGIDNLNDYYDADLKRARLRLLLANENFGFVGGDITDRSALASSFDQAQPSAVIHLAAQAGVRYSIDHPEQYMSSNIQGTFAVLEQMRGSASHLLLASSSSVYGEVREQPSSEESMTDAPVSLYAATKKSTEVISYAYSHLYDLPTTCMRFFTVYGPWGRPDMALFKFTRAILEDRPIDVYANGAMSRDFTFVDDVARSISLLASRPPSGTDVAGAPYRVVNVAGGRPVALLDYIREVERACGKKAKLNYLPPQPGDVTSTHGTATALRDVIDFVPSTPISVGVPAFVSWFRSRYQT